MFLVTLKNHKKEKESVRWIKTASQTFLIKILSRSEIERIKEDENVVEFYKIGKNYTTVIKSKINSLFVGMDL